MKKNDIVQVKIESVSESGDGIGRAPDGRVVFCFGALPGETAEVLIIKVSKNYYVGKLREILPETRSPQRREADCDVYTRCGGCAFRHASYAFQLETKEKYVHDCLQRIGGITEYERQAILPSPETVNYRNKSVYQFAEKEGELLCGFYRRNSHDIVDCSGCMVEDPRAGRVRATFLRLAKAAGLTAYDENTGSGLLRNLMVRTSYTREEAMLVIVINGECLPDAARLIDALTSECPFIVSVYINIHKQRSNAVTGERFVLLYGKEQLEDAIGDAQFLVSPQSFYQVNPSQTVRLYQKAAEFADLQEGETLLDLYCGIGTIGIFIVTECKKRGISPGGLLGIEYTEQAVCDARRNAERNGISENTFFLAGDAPRVLKALCEKEDEKSALCKSPDVVILDPPRKGCDEELIEAVAACAPSRIVYVSCNPATLARDAKRFASLGFRVEKVCPADMFPNCGHIESVVCLKNAEQN